MSGATYSINSKKAADTGVADAICKTKIASGPVNVLKLLKCFSKGYFLSISLSSTQVFKKKLCAYNFFSEQYGGNLIRVHIDIALRIEVVILSIHFYKIHMNCGPNMTHTP